jgi:hypothetical protein
MADDGGYTGEGESVIGLGVTRFARDSRFEISIPDFVS